MSLRVSGNNSLNIQSLYQMMGTLQAAQRANVAKLNQSVNPVSKVSRKQSGSAQYTDTLKYVQEYGKDMSELKLSASKLQMGSSSNVFSSIDMKSSDSSVVQVDKAFRPKEGTSISLEVEALAQAQQNKSQSVNASDKAADGSSMNFEVASARGRSVQVNVSEVNRDGSKKTNEQMYQEAADQINSSRSLGVSASVAKENGKVSLVLTSQKTGESNGFQVQGQMGSAAGAETAAVQGENARYTVTQDGKTSSRTSESNRISLDYGRVDATLKGTGSVQVNAGVDSEKIVSAVKDLAKNYNNTTDLLKENAARGRGTQDQYNSFSRPIADDRTLKAVGIRYDKSGRMQVDEKALRKALTDDFEGTKDILGGQFGLADRVAQRADSAMSTSSGRLVEEDVSSRMDRNQEDVFSSFRYLSDFSGSGPYSLGNYFTVGLMLNTLG